MATNGYLRLRYQAIDLRPTTTRQIVFGIITVIAVPEGLLRFDRASIPRQCRRYAPGRHHYDTAQQQCRHHHP